MMRIFFLFLLLTTTLTAKESRPAYRPPEVEEMRIDLEDLKHTLKTLQIDLNLIDERSKKLPASSTASLEKKIAQLEKTLDKALADLRTLHTQSTEIASKLTALEQKTAQHEKRLDDVVKLKGTLTALTKAIGQPTAAPTSHYRVKSGDSLEKIARTQGVSITTLKKINNLQSDRIIVGQELKIREDTE